MSITGITGEPLVNVQHRLIAFYKDKPMDSISLDSLREQVAKALYPYGYFKAQISVSTHDTQAVHIRIIPGPALLITKLTAKITGEGATNPELQRALHELPLHIDQPLNTIVYEKAKENLTDAAEQQGYLHATFETSRVIIDQANYTAHVILLFNTGPQYFFGNLNFKSTTIASSLLYRYTPFKYGQPYSSNKILAFNRNLANSGYFKAVNVEPKLAGSSDVPLDIDLEPVNRVSYSVGAGYGTDTGPRGRLGLNVIPVNCAGHKFNAVAQGSLQENALQTQYIIPGRNPVTDQYSVNGGYTNLHYNAGNSNAVLAGVAQQYSVVDYQRIFSLNGLNERYKYAGLTANEETIFFPKGVFTWKKISDLLFSPSGYSVTLAGLGSSKALLSQANLAQISINAKAAITFDVIRTRLYFHAIEGYTQFDDVNQLPLSLALLLGGADNLKGYSFNSIGPGKVTHYLGFEVQKETAHNLFLLGFVDRGAVYDPDLKQNRMDAGIGIMWASPVGPIKVEVAQAITSGFQRLPDFGPKLVINMGPDL